MSASRSRPTLWRTSGWRTSMTGMRSPSGAPARRARRVQARRRWRTASYRQTPLATDTFRLSTAPLHRQVHELVAGARGQLAHAAALGAEDQRHRPGRGRRRRACAARPRRCRRSGCRAPSARSSVRARFVTMKYGTVSAAPLATLATVALMPTAWSFGAITACAPAPSATRRQAPRLCGSVTPSSTSSSGGAARPRRACRRANG